MTTVFDGGYLIHSTKGTAHLRRSNDKQGRRIIPNPSTNLRRSNDKQEFPLILWNQTSDIGNNVHHVDTVYANFTILSEALALAKDFPIRRRLTYWFYFCTNSKINYIIYFTYSRIPAKLHWISRNLKWRCRRRLWSQFWQQYISYVAMIPHQNWTLLEHLLYCDNLVKTWNLRCTLARSWKGSTRSLGCLKNALIDKIMTKSLD